METIHPIDLGAEKAARMSSLVAKVADQSRFIVVVLPIGAAIEERPTPLENLDLIKSGSGVFT
jgi:hypothetical protein